MTGLDLILNKIAEDSQQRCAEIEANAKKEAQAIWEKAMLDAREEADEIVAKAEAEAAAIVARGKSAGEAASKRCLLETKNAIINDVISAAYEKLCALPDREYFSVLVVLCARFCQQGVGTMRLNKADLKRMPSTFSAEIDAAVGEGKVIISNITADIENGFVLSYGDIEVNCTFKALFDEAKDELKDIICPILF